MDRVKQIWYLSPMWAAKVQASLRIRAVSPEPSLLAHASSESRGTFRQKARSLAPVNSWACAVKICHDGMLEDTNSLDAAHIISLIVICWQITKICMIFFRSWYRLYFGWNNGLVYKTNLARTKSSSYHGPDQILLCKQYHSVPKIWSRFRSRPKRDLLMCKDHGPIEFGPVSNLDM